MFERAAGLLPRNAREWIGKEIQYAGLDYDADKFTGFIFLIGILLAIVAFMMSFYLIKLGQANSIVAFVTTFAVIFAGAIFWISNMADSRGSQVEKILPDALQLVSSNIKSGLTTERSLFVSARPEFGALSLALKKASKKIMVGERLERALLEISLNIKSKILERTMWLISEGIKNGGQISQLLVQLSSDLREENALKSEVNSNTAMYVMLIFFSAACGAPALFGISSFIVGVMTEQTANIGLDPEVMQGYSTKNPALGLIGIPTSNITESFIVLFSMVDLLVTSLFASLVLGVINSGTEKAGMKYFPPILIISLVLFFVTRVVVQISFGGLAGA